MMTKSTLFGCSLLLMLTGCNALSGIEEYEVVPPASVAAIGPDGSVDAEIAPDVLSDAVVVDSGAAETSDFETSDVAIDSSTTIDSGVLVDSVAADTFVGADADADADMGEAAGSCTTVCPTPASATSTCVGSVCGFTCLAGFADCNLVKADGCEVNLKIDSKNCGSCGTICPSGKACTAGICGVGTVLIYHDAGDTLADDAVTALGGTPNLTTSGTAFTAAYDAGGFSMIIWESLVSDIPAGCDTRMIAWMAKGERMIFSFWNLALNPGMKISLGVSTVAYSTFRSVYHDPLSPVNFFTYSETFSSPLMGSDMASINGDELTLTGAGFIAARLDSTVGKGAIAVTHANRVIIDGFLPWDTRFIDGDADGKKDMDEMFQNQISYVLKN